MAEQGNMLTYVQAINAALIEEMRRDEKVVIWGEDMTTMEVNTGTTKGIPEEFGEDRIKNTPIVESAIVDMAIGAALTGLRPIAFIRFGSMLTCCFDAVFMKLGGMPREFCYNGPIPAVICAPISGGGGMGADHCVSPEALLIHSPGLKVVMPSTPYDAKGLMKAAIRDDEPVIFLTYRALFFSEKQVIPSEEYIVPLGKADIKREGNDVTIVAYSGMVRKALAATEELSNEGISVEVVDLRSLVPLDIETIVESVKKTGRLLIAHEAMKRGGAAGEIAFRVTEAAPDIVKTMKTPIRRLAAKNLVLPRLGAGVDKMLLPQVDDIIKVVKEMV